MNKRMFLKTLCSGAIGMFANAFILKPHSLFAQNKGGKYKHWVWMRPDTNIPVEEWGKRFATLRKAGIDAILPEIFNSSKAFYGSEHLPVEDKWQWRSRVRHWRG